MALLENGHASRATTCKRSDETVCVNVLQLRGSKLQECKQSHVHLLFHVGQAVWNTCPTNDLDSGPEGLSLVEKMIHSLCQKG